MKNRLHTAAVVTVVLAALIAAPRPASALRIGVYGSAGVGSAEWQFSEHERDNLTRDTTHAGYGLILDSGSSRTLSYYRLSVGWERVDQASVHGAPSVALEGVVVDQDLVFNMFRRPGPLRFWLGPEFRVAFLSSTDTDRTDGKEDFLSLGIGPVFGFDFALNPAMAVSWKFGYLISGVAGDRADSTAFSEGHAFASFGLLFSTWSGDETEEEPRERTERRDRRSHIERRER